MRSGVNVLAGRLLTEYDEYDEYYEYEYEYEEGQIDRGQG